MRSKIFKWVVRISRFGLAALFLFTAGAKLAIISKFVNNVGQLLSSSGIDYVRWSWPAAIAVIAIEIVIALLLILPRTTRIGAVAAAGLLTAFAGYALYYVYGLHGEPLECGCFGGIIASQLGVSTALRNLALLVPAFVVWWGYRKKETKTAILKADSAMAQSEI
jgi:Methylamine utilisation protein MauE